MSCNNESKTTTSFLNSIKSTDFCDDYWTWEFTRNPEAVFPLRNPSIGVSGTRIGIRNYNTGGGVRGTRILNGGCYYWEIKVDSFWLRFLWDLQ